MTPRSHYGREYFDRWYRDPRHRVFSASERSRRVLAAVATTELVLGRTVKTVLDVGCGEGHWRAPLRRLRPRLRYTGVDSSPYVVRRFGRSRNILLGSIESLQQLELDGPFDLVLAVGFLNLMPDRALERALREVRPLVGGVALLELFTTADELTGDARRYTRHRASTYRSLLRRFELMPIGLHLHVATEVAANLGELELLEERGTRNGERGNRETRRKR